MMSVTSLDLDTEIIRAPLKNSQQKTVRSSLELQVLNINNNCGETFPTKTAKLLKLFNSTPMVAHSGSSCSLFNGPTEQQQGSAPRKLSTVFQERSNSYESVVMGKNSLG